MATGRYTTHLLHIGRPGKRIPDKHPVALEIYNPKGQFYTKMISTQGMNGFYTFDVPTQAGDPTGLWNAYIKVGRNYFPQRPAY